LYEEGKMDSKTLTRQDISEALYRQIGLSKHESAIMLESVLTQISNALINGESVKLSSFGTFYPRQKKERVGRNPKTGVTATINARRVITFKPSKLMKERINKSEKQ
jgi:integration host factor subunit alpha